MITLTGINKTFRVAKRKSGFGNAVKALFSREIERIHALKDVSFTINEGEMLGYIGPNGAGKMLSKVSLYTEEEIDIITTAISTHNKKLVVHESAYAELLKDADVLSHSLHDPGEAILEKEKERYRSLMVELGCELN